MLELDFLNQTFFNTPLRQWLIAITTVLLVFVLLRLVKRIAANRLAAIAEKTETHWDDAIVSAIKQTRTVFLLVTSLYLGSLFLQLPERVQSIFQILFIIVLLLQSGIWLTAITTTVMEQYRQRALEKNPAAATSINAIAFVSNHHRCRRPRYRWCGHRPGRSEHSGRPVRVPVHHSRQTVRDR
jgi:hypothetical protein